MEIQLIPLLSSNSHSSQLRTQEICNRKSMGGLKGDPQCQGEAAHCSRIYCPSQNFQHNLSPAWSGNSWKLCSYCAMLTQWRTFHCGIIRIEKCILVSESNQPTKRKSKLRELIVSYLKIVAIVRMARWMNGNSVSPFTYHLFLLLFTPTRTIFYSGFCVTLDSYASG